MSLTKRIVGLVGLALLPALAVQGYNEYALRRPCRGRPERGDALGPQRSGRPRAGRPDLKVLFITGYAENAALNHGHLSPGMEILVKPFALEALATRIRGLIEGAIQPSTR